MSIIWNFLSQISLIQLRVVQLIYLTASDINFRTTYLTKHTILDSLWGPLLSWVNHKDQIFCSFGRKILGLLLTPPIAQSLPPSESQVYEYEQGLFVVGQDEITRNVILSLCREIQRLTRQQERSRVEVKPKKLKTDK
jgi:hypothetical protein